ncbi:hypothetical protein BDD12DRAFT_772018 [Trichophaea hybrida]|nr:hypothetical protein BDD12DRAFT_772018 [Trichophaea hybrida]
MTRPPANYYTLLRLPPPPSPLTPQLIKKAYHAALLLHHPDKSTSTPAPQSPTVDLLTLAYKTLSSPELRAEYNLTLTSAPTAGGNGSEVVQIVDLDEFLHDEEAGRWVKACRCGKRRGSYSLRKSWKRLWMGGKERLLSGVGGVPCGGGWSLRLLMSDMRRKIDA